MQHDSLSPEPCRCRLEWGRRGVREAAARGDLLVIVDTLSFSTTVATAVHHGGAIIPCSPVEDAAAVARAFDAVIAVGRRDVPDRGRFSLSPLTYLGLTPGARVVLRSPNGATCSRYAGEVSHLYVGALVNAGAVAAAVARQLAATDQRVTVVACGERWPTPSEDGELRIAVEDYLGAGAVLASLPYPKSAEARVCEGAFLQARGDLEAILLACESGRELCERGFAADVRHAARLDLYDSVPGMRNGSLERVG